MSWFQPRLVNVSLSSLFGEISNVGNLEDAAGHSPARQLSTFHEIRSRSAAQQFLCFFLSLFPLESLESKDIVYDIHCVSTVHQKPRFRSPSFHTISSHPFSPSSFLSACFPCPPFYFLPLSMSSKAPPPKELLMILKVIQTKCHLLE